MKSIYEAIKELENISIQRKKDAKEAGENPEFEDGFLEALIQIESWVDANTHEIEDDYGNVHSVVSADME